MLAVCGRPRKATERLLGDPVGVERLAGQVDPTGQAGMQRVEPRRLVLPRGRRRDPDPRMVQQDPDQLARRVARRPHDRHTRRHRLELHTRSRRHIQPEFTTDCRIPRIRIRSIPFLCLLFIRISCLLSVVSANPWLELLIKSWSPRPATQDGGQAQTPSRSRRSEIPAPSTTSRGSYSRRSVQRPDAGNLDALPAARGVARLAEGRQDLRPEFALAVQADPARRPLRVVELRDDHPARFVGLDRDRPFLGPRRFGRQRLGPVEQRPGGRRGRPSIRPAWISSSPSVKGRNHARTGRSSARQTRNRFTQSPCSAGPRRAVEPTGQGGIVDRLAGEFGSAPSSLAIRFSIG